MKAEFEIIRRLGLRIEKPTLIGGGAKGKIWQQIMADMLDTELTLNENSDSSLGSAMLAGVASGVFSSFEDSVEKSVHRCGSVQPNPKNAFRYMHAASGIIRHLSRRWIPFMHRWIRIPFKTGGALQ